MSLSGHPWRMIVPLNTQSLVSLDEVRGFLEGNAVVGFSSPPDAQRYPWLERTLRQFRYSTLTEILAGLEYDETAK